VLTTDSRRPRGKHRGFFTTLMAGVILISGAVGLTTPAVAAVTATVNLRTATSFAVLAGSTVTNTGPSVITGDLGVSPGSAVTGFPPGIVVGVIHAADAVAAQAQSDLTIAYNDAAGRAPDVNLTGQNLGGMTLTPGVYKFDSSAFLTGTLTLNAQGDPNAAFIFQIGSTLITAPNSSVVIVNGAQACHVFYQVGSSATLDTNTTFVGNMLALTSITANTATTVDGRLLARNGAVTLDSNVVTRPVCAAVAPSVTVDKTASPTSRPAPGGDFTFSVTVNNTGTTAVTLTSLTDDVYGDLNGKGTCATGGTIVAGASYSCSFVGSFSGAAGDSQTDTITATVTDSNGTTATGSGSATVTITAPPPATGVLEICKKADNSNGPVTGSYTFTFGNRSATIPVGTCTGPLTVPAGNLTVHEVARAGTRISACATRPVDRLANCDPANSLAVVRIVAGGVGNETVLTITNRVASSTNTGAIKVCKIAGAGITVGSNFAFNVGGKAISVPAGPASQGGYCKIVYGFTRGTNVIVTEAAKSGVHVSAITVAPADRKVSASTANRTVTVKVGSGFTVVSFTNAAN
jgi:hypothetical protein